MAVTLPGETKIVTGLLDGCGATTDQIRDSIVQEITPRLGMMEEQLRQTSAQIEQAVVDICRSFQDIAARASLSVSRTTEFLQSDTSDKGKAGSFEELVSTCDTTLTKMMNASTESSVLAERAIARIEQIDQKAHEICSSLVRIEEISNGNKMLALNAQIEAARCGQAGAGFKVVAVELSSQTELSKQVTDAVGELIDSLRTMAASTMKDLQAMHGKTLERSNQCRTEVGSTLHALRETHRTMQTMFHEANNEGALLAEDIGLAIRGMQFQDRVSQRIAHVVRDLEVLGQKLPEVATGTYTNDGYSDFVMHEERAVHGIGGYESAEGNIELF